MPTYLIHGFRWSRPLIRIYIATHDLDDCAAEWIIQPPSALALLNSFYTLFDFIPPCQQPTSASSASTTATTTLSPPPPPPPGTKLAGSVAHGRSALAEPPKLAGFNAWAAVKLLEQHCDRCLVASQPCAFVGDYVVPVALAADVGAEMAAYEARRREQGERVAAAAAAAQGTGTGGPPVSFNGQSGAGGGAGGNRLRSRMSVSELRRAERQIDWIEKLRDKLQPNAVVGWYVVVCDDEERRIEEEDEGLGDEINDDLEVEAVELKEKSSMVRLRGLFARKERDGEREKEKEKEAEKDKEKEKERERPIVAGGRKISKARRPL